tara:strand:+ start:2072 stop:2398 length:327 start_codon:yes stop_codon:yes gene_type:complete
MDDDYSESNPIKYLKENYDIENIMHHPKIKKILKDEHKMRFLINMRRTVEDLNQKYIDLYSYSGIFKNDFLNSNWERAYDIIYSNIIISYDINIIYDNADRIINILEK